MVALRLTLIALVAALLVAGCGGAPEAAAPANAPYVTIIGYTESTGNHISDVTVKDVPPGVYPFHEIATLHEGTRVQMLDHNEDAALIVTADGTRGWVLIDFIREMNP